MDLPPAARLRTSQALILQYRAGKMAVSAVPGSGKTFVLARLAADLIASGVVDVGGGARVLVVTFLNSAVDGLRSRIGAWLHELHLPLAGYEVRTLHSLAHEILSDAAADAGIGSDFSVLDDGRASLLLSRAVDGWIRDNPLLWRAFLPGETAGSPRMRVRWREITQRTAQDFIRFAKQNRYSPGAIRERLDQEPGMIPATGPDAANLDLEIAERCLGETGGGAPGTPADTSADRLLAMLSGIHSRYQSAVESQGAVDFDDLVWQAADLLERDQELVPILRRRWPYVLEDEAQDSVPLQESMLSTLCGSDGNWVRVGDPNQAITSSFTSADPRHFRAFLTLPGVVTRVLPESGRSSPKIIGLANRLVDWACLEHPMPEVRERAFRLQHIRPTAPGDTQLNPADAERSVGIRVYQHRERGELPSVAQAAWQHTARYPERTCAILVPTNEVGYSVAGRLDKLGARYDELLRDSGRMRQVAGGLCAVLALLAQPLERSRLVDGFSALLDLGALPSRDLASTDRAHLLALMRSVNRPEALLYPPKGAAAHDALPPGVATTADRQLVEAFARRMRGFFEAMALPADALVLALADELFCQEADLAAAYQISSHFRTLLDANPGWRLPELAAQLERIAAGRAHLPGSDAGELGYEPKPGWITLTTQHRAKGLEWDTVVLVGIDGYWIPDHLDARFVGEHEFLGGDPGAEARARLSRLMEGDAGLLPGLDSTDNAHFEVICERLRLLYVGITRARRNLFLSRSREVSVFERDVAASPTAALGVLHRHLRGAT